LKVKNDVHEKRLKREFEIKERAQILYTEFKSGCYDSLRHFHREYPTGVSLETLSRYFRKYISEYNPTTRVAYKLKRK
jgi:hypothetical protein